MRLRPLLLSALFLLVAVIWLGVSPLQSPAYPAGAQQTPPQGSAKPAGSIQAESNLVLVDAVVTDKKGNYIRDLEAKDFEVYQDDAEQKVTSFSRASEAAGPNAPGQKRYIVLFFANSTMET